MVSFLFASSPVLETDGLAFLMLLNTSQDYLSLKVLFLSDIVEPEQIIVYIYEVDRCVSIYTYIILHCFLFSLLA